MTEEADVAAAARESRGTELCAAAALGDIDLLKLFLADGTSVGLHVEMLARLLDA